MNINALELKAIRSHLLLLRCQGWYLFIRTDNVSAKSHIKKQGGPRSSILHTEVHFIFSSAEKHLHSISVEHIKESLNI